MKFLIQRVTKASVSVDNKIIGSINKGFLIFVGISSFDDKTIADLMINKVMKLRIFEDENGKTNLSLSDVDGECLIVSQFTLYANCKKGNRPSFIEAGKPDMASELYNYILDKTSEYCSVVEHGIFGADMKVELLNDGPFTIMLDSEEIL